MDIPWHPDGPLHLYIWRTKMISKIAKFMGPTSGPPGSCRPQKGPMLAPLALLSGIFSVIACRRLSYQHFILKYNKDFVGNLANQSNHNLPRCFKTVKWLYLSDTNLSHILTSCSCIWRLSCKPYMNVLVGLPQRVDDFGLIQEHIPIHCSLNYDC